MNINIKMIESCNNFHGDQIIDLLSKILCFEEPERIESIKKFWSEWLSNKIVGEKITIFAEEIDKDNKKNAVGVVRFWKTPFCNNKWLIEGLEVIKPKRGLGIGESMVQYGLNQLKINGIEKVSANIVNNNVASIKLHESLGFRKISTGSINSYGDYREHVDEYIFDINRISI